jgi:hypothetical protein
VPRATKFAVLGHGVLERSKPARANRRVSDKRFVIEFETTGPSIFWETHRISAASREIHLAERVEKFSPSDVGVRASRRAHRLNRGDCRLGLIVRPVGMVRASVKIGLANPAYNFARLA